MAVAGNDRAEAERARTVTQQPQPNPPPTMTMSLEQPLTVEAPAEEEIPEATTLPVTPEQSGEHALRRYRPAVGTNQPCSEAIVLGVYRGLTDDKH